MYHRHTLVANLFSTFKFDDRCSILASLAWLQGHRCDEVAELWPWCMPWWSKCWQRYLASEVSPIRLLHGSGTSPMHWIHVSRCRCVLRTRQGAVCLRCCRRIRLTIVATRVLNQHRSLDARIGFTFAAFATAAHEAVMRHECATLVALYAHRKAAIDNRLISAWTKMMTHNESLTLTCHGRCWFERIGFVRFDLRANMINERANYMCI